MDHSQNGSRSRARRSLYTRSRPGWLRSFLALALIVALGVLGLAAWHAIGLVRATTGSGNPLSELAKASGAEPGTIPYKLQHGQRVNLLLLGYGGAENDAPWLTDSIMVLSIDPSTHRAVEVSIPRDLMVPIDAFSDHRSFSDKINVAYAVGMDDADWAGKSSQFRAATSPDAGGRLAEQTVTNLTGLHFDGFVGVDFLAFRDLVNALGGVQICLSGPLDDYQYPNYKDGYVKGGIHFPSGCQQVNGEQALELARSRHATESAAATDFARAARQRQLLDAIRRKAASLGAIRRAPALMSALQKNFITDLGLADLNALYSYSSKLSAASIASAALTDSNLTAPYYEQPGSCGPWGEYVLCAIDPSFANIKQYFAHLIVDPKVLAEQAPIQLVNASLTLPDMGQRVGQALAPLGFKLAPPIRGRTDPHSVVYDYSGGRYPLTARWLASYFQASVVVASSASPASVPGAEQSGLVVVLGHDFALHWIGQ
ncbi:MAG TPA: LCP family protein [Candidatus Acidoferrales bacterium]|nr:LCP family protein [Candidatus Acidoferrales bacterium]